MKIKISNINQTGGRYKICNEGYVVSVKKGVEKILKNRTVGRSSRNIPKAYSLKKLASEYGVSKKLILLIIQNKIWKNGQII
jgi:hypothetical protein